MTATFQTNQLKSRRKAIIDGHEYTVRRRGNIEQLELLDINDEIKSVLAKYPADVPDDEISEEDKALIGKRSLQSAEMLFALFDDGTKDQSKSKRLVRSLDHDDIISIIEDTFAQTEEDAKS